MMNTIASTSIIFGFFFLFSLMPSALASNQNSEARPSDARVQGATHHFDYEVQRENLIGMTIDFPEDVIVSKVLIKDHKSGQLIPAKVDINLQSTIISFDEKISPGTMISIDMRGVTTSGYASNWSYLLTGNFTDIDRDIPLGNRTVRTYD